MKRSPKGVASMPNLFNFPKSGGGELPYVVGTFNATGATQTISLGFTPSAVLISGKLAFYNHTSASGANFTKNGAAFAVIGAPSYRATSNGQASESAASCKIVDGGFTVNDATYEILNPEYNPYRYIAFR